MSIGTSPVTTPPERAQRLLAALHQVCSHDLSNQAVALESMLHLFTMDEGECLSSQAQEYLHRLHSVSRKITSLAHFLRDLVRLNQHEVELAPLSLDRFALELRDETRHGLPEHELAWERQFQVATIVVDRHLLLQGVGAFLQASAEAFPTAKALRVVLTSTQKGGVVHLSVTVAPQGDVAITGLSPTTMVERRLEYSLAQELLALAGITSRLDNVRGAAALALTLPERTSHG